ncbi:MULTISPECIES: hypothetical protein [unclassified Crossiella]|uniref:hypothetical protein n=1 Tax=unclassified Crossiella TaxID=2620835 RepID=UPI001FFE590F|nr:MULTISPECIES: hypothetical protein [unclassified Crossiella]MCK2242734.1 hypothetical protein [Crossiella sp. S99.2]MCK2256611.1 hypothetical protein [Crossiella sp. S99.1]
MADPDEHLLTPSQRKLLDQQKRENPNPVPVDVQGSLSQAGRYRIDPAHAGKALAKLEEALAEVRAIGRDSLRLQQLDPPYNDPYSKAAVKAITQRASDEQGCHGKANRDLAQTLENMINNIKAMVREHENTEGKNKGIGGHRS